MKLIVTFADEDSFSFRNDTICLRVSNLNRLQDVINNSELRQDFIDGNRILLEAAYDDTLIDEIYAVKNMPYFEDFSGFESIKIALNKGVSTCGDCPDLETCPTVGAILENNPAALDNLKG